MAIHLAALSWALIFILRLHELYEKIMDVHGLSPFTRVGLKYLYLY